MADGTVPINPGAGVLVDTDQLTVGSNIVQRQRLRLAGAAAAEIADVKNAAPGMTTYGQVVRIPGPPGQDFGSIVTPEIGYIYVSGKVRAPIGTVVFQSGVVAATGTTVLAGISNTSVYVFHLVMTSDVVSTLYFRTNNVAGPVRYCCRLQANVPFAVTPPMGTFLCNTFASEGLFIDCSATITTLVMTILYAQV